MIRWGSRLRAYALSIESFAQLWLLQSCSPPTFSLPRPSATAAPPAVCPLGPMSDWLQSILLFGARACSLAFNQALWIYTTELYPAQGLHQDVIGEARRLDEPVAHQVFVCALCMMCALQFAVVVWV
jgi:hypothetical protein